jgi:hypothetical protein
MTKYCKHCGAANKDKAQYCDNCGEKFEKVLPQKKAEQKRLEDILSEPMNIIMENQVILALYMVPVILLFIGFLITRGVTISEITFSWVNLVLAYVLAFLGFSSLFSIIPWISIVVADAFTIKISSNEIRGEGKRATLSEIWNSIGVERILKLLVASLIISILGAIGSYTYWIVTAVVLIPPIFVQQCILIDDLDIKAALKNSYNIAKDNLMETAALVLIFVVLDTIFALIPWIGWILEVFLAMYFTVALTILYIDRK